MLFPSLRFYFRACLTVSMLVSAAAILGCAWLTPVSVLARESSEDPVEVVFFKARTNVEAGDYEAAIELLEPYSQKDSTPPEILVLLAEAYLSKGDLEGGEAVLSRTLGLYADYVPAHEMRASVYRRQGKKAEAIADLEAALAIVPRNAAVLEALGSLRLRSLESWDLKSPDSDLSKTVSLYERLAEVRSGSEKITPLIVLASIYSRVGEVDKAIAYASQATAIRSHDLRAQLTLASVYEEAGRLEPALATYRQALLVEPANTVIQAKIAELLNKTGAKGGPVAFYAALAADFPGVREVQELYANELIKAEEWDKAIVLYTSLCEKYGDSNELKAGLVKALLAANREGEAMALVGDLLADEETDTQVILDLAEALRGRGQIDEVIGLLEKARAAGNEDRRLALALAQVQLQAGDKEAAVKTLEAIVAENPGLFPVVALLSDVYAEDGRYEDARKLLAGLDETTRSRRGAEIQMREANLYRLEGKPLEAARVLEELLATSEEPSDLALRALVEIYSDAGEKEKALSAADRFIAATSGEANRGARGIKAWLYWRNRQYADAIALLEELYAEDSSDFATLQLLVENYAGMGDFDKAEGLMQAAGTQAVGEVGDDYLILRARLFHLQNRHAEAAETAEKLLAREDDNDSYLMIAGEYYYEAGRMEDAERVLRRAIELDPSNAEAYNALGYFFAEAGIKLDEALVLVKKAMELDPEAGHIVDSLGWIHFMQGQYDEAARALERAVEMMKDSPDAVVYEHLGDAYSRAGREAEAREAYKKALELDPGSKTLLEKLN